jgi:hypothetical protein
VPGGQRAVLNVCMYACMHACMYACMYLCMYVCIYACMSRHMRVCVYMPPLLTPWRPCAWRAESRCASSWDWMRLLWSAASFSACVDIHTHTHTHAPQHTRECTRVGTCGSGGREADLITCLYAYLRCTHLPIHTCVRLRACGAD